MALIEQSGEESVALIEQSGEESGSDRTKW